MRASGACTHFGGVAVADEVHTIVWWPAVQPLRQQYGPTSTNRSAFFAQHCLQVFKLVFSHGQHIRCPPNTQKQDYLVHSTAGHSGLTSQTNFTRLITWNSYACIVSELFWGCLLQSEDHIWMGPKHHIWMGPKPLNTSSEAVCKSDTLLLRTCSHWLGSLHHICFVFSRLPFEPLP